VTALTKNDLINAVAAQADDASRVQPQEQVTRLGLGHAELTAATLPRQLHPPPQIETRQHNQSADDHSNPLLPPEASMRCPAA